MHSEMMAALEEKADDRIYRILIVDDEKNALILLHTALKRAKQFKSDIRIAENCTTAWAELEKQDFDLVLSDYMMPGTNGIEFLTKVKERFPGTIRVLITAYSGLDIAKEAINKADVHFFIEKPWKSDELIMLISEALSGQRKGESRNKTRVDTADQDLPVGLIPIGSKENTEKD